MEPIERLQLLQAATGLIADNANRELQIDRCAEFTRRAAYELRDLGWGNIAKTSGTNRQGLSIDKMVNPRANSLVDIIVSADSENPRLDWQERPATLMEASLYVPPLAPPGEPAGGNGGNGGGEHLPPDVGSLEARIEALFEQTIETLGAGILVWTEVNQRLKDLQRDGLQLHVLGR